VGDGAGAGGAPDVNVPVTIVPLLPAHCVDMLVPLRVNVATGISALPSAWVMATVAALPLAVPLTGSDWLTGTHPVH